MVPLVKIEGECFYTVQLFSPKHPDDLAGLKDDLDFVCKSFNADTSTQKWFPRLFSRISLLKTDADSLMDFFVGKLIPRKRVYLSIRSMQNRGIIGFLGFDVVNTSCDQLFFYLDSRYRGRGIITDVLTRLVKYLVLQGNVRELFADVHRDNLPSISVLKRIGMQQHPIILEEPNVKYYMKF